MPIVAHEALAALIVLATISACDSDPCAKVCKRVAFCKEESQKSAETVLGEREPPANRHCMERCRSHGDNFATCEASERTCSALRDCLGSSFEY